jgi:hypothetical protein
MSKSGVVIHLNRMLTMLFLNIGWVQKKGIINQLPLPAKLFLVIG